VANMTEFGKSPLLSLQALNEMGYAAAIYPVTLLRLAMNSATTALAHIATHGSQAGLLEAMQTRQELYDLLGYTAYETRDQSYFQDRNSAHE